jgi:hypothetical protein
MCIAGQVKTNWQKKAGVSLRKEAPPAANYSSSLPLASGNRAIGFTRRVRVKTEEPHAGCVRPLVLIRLVSLDSKSLLRHLTADFAGRIGCGVDVDVVLARRQIGRLSVRQRRAAFGGA